MTRDLREFSRTALRAVLPLLLLFPLAGYAQTQVDWAFGDLFAETGSGTTQVWRSANPGANNPTYSVVQTFTDGIPGASPGTGCTVDSAYRLFTTNFAHTDIVRFTIDNAHPIAQTIAGGATSNFRNSESIAFDGTGNFYVGYAGTTTSLTGGGLEMYNHAGALQHVFSPTVENSGVDWLDVAQDGHTVFYTSKGRKIFMFDTLNPGAGSSVWADLSKFNGQLSAIRIIPGGALNAANGVLVADQSNVRLVTKNSSGVVSVQSFNFGGNNHLQSLTLDPSLANRAWVGDVSSNVLIRFNFLTGKKEVTLSIGTSSPGGICAEGGFSAAQVKADSILAPLTSQSNCNTTATANALTCALTPTSNTVFFTSPFTGAKFTATLTDLTNNVTIKARDSLVHPSVAQSDPKVFTLIPGSGGITGTANEHDMPCDTTLTSMHQPPIPNACEIFEFEASSDASFTTTNLQIDKPSALVETTPNLRMLRNFDEALPMASSTIR